MRIAVIGGDGTGPEVVAEGLKTLKAVSEKVGFDYTTKQTIPVVRDEEIAELRTFDAIYLGAVGHPKIAPGILEKGVLLRLRFDLDQYINLRPVRLYPNVETPIKGKGPEDI